MCCFAQRECRFLHFIYLFLSLCCLQIIIGVDPSTYNSNQALFSNTLKTSIAMCMEGVDSRDILNLVITATSGNVAHTAAVDVAQSLRNKISTLTSSSMNAAYQVSVVNPALSFDSLSAELTNAVTSGQFTTYLQNISAQTGATALQSASCSFVTTTNLIVTTSNPKSNSNVDLIVSIVVGFVAFIVIIAAGACYSGLLKRKTATTSSNLTPTTLINGNLKQGDTTIPNQNAFVSSPISDSFL